MEQTPFPPDQKPLDLAAYVRARLCDILTARLAYYLGHLPTDAEFHRLWMRENGQLLHYYYGLELLMVTDTVQLTVAAWEPITEAVLYGSALGSGPIELILEEYWSRYIGGFRIVITPPSGDQPSAASFQPM